MLTLFFVVMNVFAVRAEAPEAPKRSHYRIDAYGSYFTTSSNYEAGGSSTRGLNDDGEFTDINGTALYTQDFDRTSRVYGGFSYGSVESYDGFFTRNNAGLKELMVGGQYWMSVAGF